MSAADRAFAIAMAKSIPKGDKGDPGDISEINGKTGSSVTLDAGDLGYDSSETYTSGTVGAGISNALSAINNLTPLVEATFPQKTITDTPIATFTDGADNVPIKALTVDIDPIQNLHGYDNPWPAGAGANIWDEEWEQGTLNYVNGELTYSETNIRSKNFIPVTPSTSYFPKKPSDINIVVCGYDEDFHFTHNSRYSAANTAFTVDADTKYIKFCTIGTPQYGGTYKNNIAINYPSTVETYSPYENNCPIYGFTGANISKAAINIWDGVKAAGHFDDNTGAYDSLGGWTMSSKIPALPNTKYYFKAGTSSGSPSYVIGCWDAADNWLGRVMFSAGNAAITTKANTAYIRFEHTLTATGESINYPYTDTDYHEYVGAVVPVAFPDEAGTVYGGYLTLNEDGSADLVSDRIIQTTFTIESIGTNAQSGLNYASAYFATGASGAANSEMLSNQYVQISNSATPTASGQMKKGTQTFTLYNKAFAGMTKEEVAEYLVTEGVQVLLMRATPASFHIGPEDAGIIRTLYGLNNVWSDTGDIDTMAYRADPASYQAAQLASALNVIDSMIANVETSYTASKAYSVNDFLSVDGKLYIVTADIASGATITPNTNVTETTVGEQLAAILNS